MTGISRLIGVVVLQGVLLISVSAAERQYAGTTTRSSDLTLISGTAAPGASRIGHVAAIVSEENEDWIDAQNREAVSVWFAESRGERSATATFSEENNHYKVEIQAYRTIITEGNFIHISVEVPKTISSDKERLRGSVIYYPRRLMDSIYISTDSVFEIKGFDRAPDGIGITINGAFYGEPCYLERGGHDPDRCIIIAGEFSSFLFNREHLDLDQ